MRKAVVPGTFDPITNGHIDIIRRAAEMYDELTICVMENRAKKSLFTVEERIHMLELVTKDIPNVRVDSYYGLLIDYAKSIGAHISIRGLRAVTDFEYELQIAQTNRLLSHGELDTMFMITSLEYAYLSSSGVKEIASFGGDISPCVPPVIEKLMKEKYPDQYK